MRVCLGGELGLGAEISFIFGFTDTATTSQFECFAIKADLDVGLLFAAGVATGISK